MLVCPYVFTCVTTQGYHSVILHTHVSTHPHHTCTYAHMYVHSIETKGVSFMQWSSSYCTSSTIASLVCTVSYTPSPCTCTYTVQTMEDINEITEYLHTYRDVRTHVNDGQCTLSGRVSNAYFLRSLNLDRIG